MCDKKDSVSREARESLLIVQKMRFRAFNPGETIWEYIEKVSCRFEKIFGVKLDTSTIESFVADLRRYGMVDTPSESDEGN